MQYTYRKNETLLKSDYNKMSYTSQGKAKHTKTMSNYNLNWFLETLLRSPNQCSFILFILKWNYNNLNKLVVECFILRVCAEDYLLLEKAQYFLGFFKITCYFIHLSNILW